MILAIAFAIVLSNFAKISTVSAQTPDGTIASAVGQVSIVRNGATIPAAAGMPVSRGDRIATGADGQAIVRVADQSKLELGPSTSISLDQFAGGGAAPTRVGLFSGILRSVVKSAGGVPANYQIHTPNAVAAVRGTDFYTSYESESAEVGKFHGCAQYTTVDVRNGVVNLAQITDPDNGINLEFGDDGTVPCDRGPILTNGCSTQGAAFPQAPEAGTEAPAAYNPNLPGD
ncbi:MAG TPA: FecR family protein [Candidatus Binataceae bacterium]|nr:FecR family protein [Candidatus Binataceae bacterium]